MALVPRKTYMDWFDKSSWVYKNYKKFYVNKAWDINHNEKGGSLCVFFWKAILGFIFGFTLVPFARVVSKFFKVVSPEKLFIGFFAPLAVITLIGLLFYSLFMPFYLTAFSVTHLLTVLIFSPLLIILVNETIFKINMDIRSHTEEEQDKMAKMYGKMTTLYKYVLLPVSGISLLTLAIMFIKTTLAIAAVAVGFILIVFIVVQVFTFFGDKALEASRRNYKKDIWIMTDLIDCVETNVVKIEKETLNRIHSKIQEKCFFEVEISNGAVRHIIEWIFTQENGGYNVVIKKSDRLDVVNSYRTKVNLGEYDDKIVKIYKESYYSATLELLSIAWDGVVTFFLPARWVWGKLVSPIISYGCELAAARKQGICPYVEFTDVNGIEKNEEEPK